jgi:hypothetical protein
VKLFLRHDWLVYDPVSSEIALSDSILAHQDRYRAVIDYYRESYLAADVQAFNLGDKSVFRVENGRIRSFDVSRHNILLPFADQRRWRGVLTYRPEGSRGVELSGGGVLLELREPKSSLSTRNRAPQVVEVQETADVGPRVDTDLAVVTGQGGSLIGKAHLIGEYLIFNNRSPDAGTSVAVSGEPVLQGNRARIDGGDLLKLTWRFGGRTQYGLLWNTDLGDAPVISSNAFLNGRQSRLEAANAPGLTGDVVRALDRTVDRENRSNRRFDLALSLDARIHEVVQRELETYSARFYDGREAPFRGAVTVMDASTGDLLALASYPAVPERRGCDSPPAAQPQLL